MILNFAKLPLMLRHLWLMFFKKKYANKFSLLLYFSLTFTNLYLFGWKSEFLVNAIQYSYILALVPLIFIFNKPAKMVLGNESKREYFFFWIAKWFLVQILFLVCLFCSIALFWGYTADLQLYKPMVEFSGFAKAVLEFNQHKLFFTIPFAFCGLWAVIVLYFSKVKGVASSFPACAASGYSKHKAYHFFRDCCSLSTSTAAAVLIAFMLATVVMCIPLILEHCYHFGLFKNNILIFLFLPVCTIPFMGKPFVKLIRLFNRLHLSLNFYFVFFVVFMVSVCLLLNHAIEYYIVEKVKTITSKFIILPHILAKFEENYFSKLFVWSLSIVSVPLLGSYFAKISQGRTIREIMFASLILPILLLLVSFYLSYIEYKIDFAFLDSLQFDCYMLAGIIVLFSSVLFSLGHKTYGDSVLVLGYYPNENKNRLRGLASIVPNIILIAINFVIISFKFSWLLSTLLLTFNALLLLYAFLFAVIALMKTLIVDIVIEK